MQKIVSILMLFVFVVFSFPSLKAQTADIIGGDISWQCQGNGDIVLELKLFRDCNGADVVNTQNLQVWGHPSITSIPLNLIERKDCSPNCTAAGGIGSYSCGQGTGGGNGLGAVEEIKYQSAPISITGTPPSGGWHFTFSDNSIGSTISSVQNPSSIGITLAATMFAIPGYTGTGCIDSSPKFLQSPHFITLLGNEYSYNPNAVDTDLDSLHFYWAEPLDNFTSGSYSPPINPISVPFVSGYTYTNPTPGINQNANNQPAVLNPQNGEIRFLSHTNGQFLAKVAVDSYRKGVKIATVERQMQFVVANWSDANTKPIVTPPFAGGTSFDTTIIAGNPIDFKIKAIDNDLLQDGTAQSITISASGMMFGTGFASTNNGCGTTPCAVLDYPPSITNVGNATLGLNWQTACDHLVGTNGEAQEEVPYHFVFKIQDDYCPIPQVEYVTVTVNVKNKTILPPPNIRCISTNNQGDVIVRWEPITDTIGTFSGYEIGGVNGGNYGVITNINANNYTISGGVGAAEDFYVSTLSGCNGNTKRNSDTLTNIHLDLTNPGTGVANLAWNRPATNFQNTFGAYYYIYREYPVGTWKIIDSVPYNTTNYIDTITICEDFLNYKIVLPTSQCDYVSNIEGDLFQDNIVPTIPIISSVSIDTLTGDITVYWDENKQPDTYGYVVYQTDNYGNIVEIDTVWGKGNTSYTHWQNPNNGPYQYSVAAFDSCYTANVPPTYQTSAKANPHTTIYLQSKLDICDRNIHLTWTDYIGFDSLLTYIIYVQKNEEPWKIVGFTNDNFFDYGIAAGDVIQIAIQAVSSDNNHSFSNVQTVGFSGSQTLDVSYLTVATVDEEVVKVRHRISLGAGASKIELERYNPRFDKFEKIDEKQINNETEIEFIDPDVEVHKYSYFYRTNVIDTCNQSLGYSNVGKTVHLEIYSDESTGSHTLQWTPYERFIGNLHKYEVYRAINGTFEPAPIAVLPPEVRTFTDTVGFLYEYSEGKTEYVVLAREGNSEYGLEETSVSNIASGLLQPLIYIPTAFSVGGNNPIFKPVTGQRKFTNYDFRIYDRFGSVVFSTNDPYEGWNGEIKKIGKGHSVAKEGVYIYYLSLRDGDGIEVVKRGHVTLLDYSDPKY